MQSKNSSISIQKLPFHQNSPPRRRFKRCHGGLLARPAPPRPFGLKKRTSCPLVSRASRGVPSMRLTCLHSRCALALVPHCARAASASGRFISQNHVDSDASTASRMAADALDLRGKDDCLRAPHTCARVITQLGSSKKARLLRQQCDFLKVSRIDLLVAARLVDVEGRVNGDARRR